MLKIFQNSLIYIKHFYKVAELADFFIADKGFADDSVQSFTD